MGEFHKIWIKQCDAARDIREAFGLQKTLGDLIGEKLLNFLRAADQDPAFEGELPGFVEEIRDLFDRSEIQTYLDDVHRVGPLGHVTTDEVYEQMRDAGAVDEDPRRRAPGAEGSRGGTTRSGACAVLDPGSRVPRRSSSSDDGIACAEAVRNYIHDTYGRFPGTVDTMHPMWMIEAHHLHLDFYARFFEPGVCGQTHLAHMQTWHRRSAPA